LAEFLHSIDLGLFHLINGVLHIGVLDWFMPFLTDLNKQNAVLFIVAFAWLGLLLKGGARGRTAALLLIPIIIFSDQFSSHVIKELVGRLRPCYVLPDVRLLVPCGSGLSFPSSHAVNNFAAATLFGYYYPRGKWVFFSIAALVAYSRVYVGVHYPSDVLGGALIGVFCAALVIALYEFLRRRMIRFVKKGVKKTDPTHHN